MRLIFVTLLGLAGVARAEPHADFTLRLDLPTVIRDSNDGWYQLFGAVASYRHHMFTAELAADYWATVCQKGLVFTVRAGAVLPIAKSASWVLRVPVLAGVTRSTLAAGGCDEAPDEKIFALTVATGLEATRSSGFTLRLLAWAGRRHDERFGEKQWETIHSATLSVGITSPL